MIRYLSLFCLTFTLMACDTARTSNLTRAADGTYFQVVSGRSSDLFTPGVKSQALVRYKVVDSDIPMNENIRMRDVREGRVTFEETNTFVTTAAGPSVGQHFIGATSVASDVLLATKWKPDQTNISLHGGVQTQTAEQSAEGGSAQTGDQTQTAEGGSAHGGNQTQTAEGGSARTGNQTQTQDQRQNQDQSQDQTARGGAGGHGYGGEGGRGGSGGHGGHGGDGGNSSASTGSIRFDPKIAANSFVEHGNISLDNRHSNHLDNRGGSTKVNNSNHGGPTNVNVGVGVDNSSSGKKRH